MLRLGHQSIWHCAIIGVRCHLQRWRHAHARGWQISQRAVGNRPLRGRMGRMSHRNSSKEALLAQKAGRTLESGSSLFRCAMSSLVESSEQQPSLTTHLANGLEVRLMHRPGTTLCAVLVEVRGGSHDEPGDYPGLAHYLEHLVFLGSREFPPEQGLIPFVQGLGGRVNASTRPRSTRFFCEVPEAHIDQALARLLDMLANPLLETAALWREREVLQAEFSARARDCRTLCDAALAWALAAGHPLADFHAGNAASLKLESPAFMPALHRFHRDHYQPGRMCLTLIAPHPLEQQLELARRYGEPLQAGRGLPEPVVPPMLPLRAKRLRLGVPGGGGRLLLAFAVAQQGDALEAATAFLECLVQDDSAGGLQERLGVLELSDGVHLRLSCADGGQGLLVMDFERVDGADCVQLEAEVLGWLDFLRATAPWPGRWEERLERLRRRHAELAPLDAAMAHRLPTFQEVQALLEQLRVERLIHLQADDSDCASNQVSAGFPLNLERLEDGSGGTSSGNWRLPPPNPYLIPSAPLVATQTRLPARPALPEASGQGALFLHWQPADSGLPHGLVPALQRALRPILGAAAGAGVTGGLKAEQGGITLELLGDVRVLRHVSSDVLPLLQAPPLWSLGQGPRLQRSAARRNAGELPLRQMLQHLPGLLAAATEAPAVLTAEALAHFWQQARWQGLAVGDGAVDAELPGLPATPSVLAGQGGRTWHRLEMEGEAALLLFYPLDPANAGSEASARLLASLLEPAFHQRLRGELQLGYALACGFKQFGPHRGLLFAVQSPRESVAGLFAHLQDFLQRQSERLAALDQAQLDDLRLNLAQRLVREDMEFASYARQCWLDHLAGLPVDHRSRVLQALTEQQPSHLQEQLDCLIAGTTCLALANAETPAPGWHLSY
ncbi:pyrroloquinoline quinone biosynthesis protein PqqF [Pseudomonas sp. BN515]|nr:pyrroloquinoline quinone biosynthesis protein PqqF [Pseudomonas sp. BN515]